MTEIDFTTEPIELIDTIKSIIVDYYEWFIGIYDLSNINSVDELIESFREYLLYRNYNPEFNLDDVINYYNIGDLDDRNILFITSYEDDDEMDSKFNTRPLEWALA